MTSPPPGAREEMDLDSNWLQIEMVSIDEEIARWPLGLRQSYDCLLRQIASRGGEEK